MTNETTKLEQLGKNIRYYRKLKSLSQNELAELLDVSREHLAKVETAKRYASLQLLFKIAKVLDVKLVDLVNF